MDWLKTSSFAVWGTVCKVFNGIHRTFIVVFYWIRNEVTLTSRESALKKEKTSFNQSSHADYSLESLNNNLRKLFRKSELIKLCVVIDPFGNLFEGKTSLLIHVKDGRRSFLSRKRHQFININRNIVGWIVWPSREKRWKIKRVYPEK